MSRLNAEGEEHDYSLFFLFSLGYDVIWFKFRGSRNSMQFVPAAVCTRNVMPWPKHDPFIPSFMNPCVWNGGRKPVFQTHAHSWTQVSSSVGSDRQIDRPTNRRDILNRR